jgi:heavy metal translocating P-type ATPase
VTARLGLPLAALLAILSGLALRAGPFAFWATPVWLVALVILGLPIIWRTVRGMFGGHFAADLVATLAIAWAVALVQPLPGLVVVLMQSGGEALEDYAAGRASRAVQELEALAPRQATRLGETQNETIPVEAIAIGDRLLVRPGEMIPCDSEVLQGYSHVDASRLTGEPIPVTAGPGVRLMSGSLNVEGPLEITARAVSRESQYARIVELVRGARASKSPLQRMADRYAVVFTPVTLAVCLVSWLASRDPVRVLAVLVVATPCPLILAAPVAMIGGLSRAARHGIIVRHGEALERLGQVSAAVLDKTGTLTVGHPEVCAVRASPPLAEEEVLGLAAAIDSGSSHMLARPIVALAKARGLVLPVATEVVESPGQGVVGSIGGREVAIGSRRFLYLRYPALAHGRPGDGTSGLKAWLAIDGEIRGTIEFADRLRPEALELVRRLRQLGMRRIIMATGDSEEHAAAIAREVGLEEFRAGLLPGDKVTLVEELEGAGVRVLMVGDGTNDAPALSRATVGVALAASGGGVTAEAADAVILADDPGLVAKAVIISRQTLTIARQSVLAGLGLSGLAMLVAATGHIPPTVGALLQEVIDVAVILNALRASGE